MALYKLFVLFGVCGLSWTHCTQRIILKLSIHVSANLVQYQRNNLYILEDSLGTVILDSFRLLKPTGFVHQQV